MKMKSSLFSLLSICGLAFFLSITASSASAANLLVNPDFDTDISGWEDPWGHAFVVASHDDTMDHDDTPVIAGSLKLQVSTIGTGLNGVLQCVQVTPGATYVASGYIYRATQDPKPTPYLYLMYFETTDCSLGVGSEDTGQLPTNVVDQWFEVSFQATVPENASSAWFRLVSSGTTDSSLTTVYFDHLYLPEPDQGALGGAALLTLLMLRSFHRGCRRKRAGLALK